MSLIDQKHGSTAKTRELVFRCFVFCSCVCLMMQIFSIPYKIYALTSLSNKALLFSWLLLGCYVLIVQLLERATIPFVCVLFIVLMTGLSFGIAVVFEPSVFSALGNVFGFLMLPTMLYCIKSWGISYKTKKVVLLCNLAMSLQYILLYHSSLRHSFDGSYGTVNISSVTLGFPNPNQTATMLFVCLVLLFISFFFFENKKVKAIVLLDFIYTAYMMIETESRTSALLLAVLIFLSIVAMKKRLRWYATELSLLSPVVYMVLAVAFISLLSFIQISGDNIFTGRETIYAKYFDNLNPVNFLFGDFSLFRFENLHNGYLSVAATVGIVVLVAYYVLFRQLLKDAYKNLTHRYEWASYCGFLCMVIYTCTEAGFLVGGSMYAFLIAMVFFMLPTADTHETTVTKDDEG